MHVLALLYFLFTTFLEAKGNFGCGYEYEQPKPKAGVVVRPFDLPKVNLAALTKPRYILKQLPPLLTTPPLKPSGDLCSCKATVVSPALVPKPAVGLRFDTTSKLLQRLQAAYATQNQASYSAQAPPAVVLPPSSPPQSYAVPLPNYATASTSYAAPQTYAHPDPVPVPSDPVSLQLALKAQREAVKSLEDKLSFGFRSMPIDAAIKQATALKTPVPEENLLAMNGAVVALQPAREVQVQRNVDDEAAEALTKTQDVEVVPSGKKPTLGELGFAPANIVPPPTYTLAAPAAPVAVAAAPGTSSAVVHTAVPATYGVPGAPALPCNEVYPGQVQTGSTPNRETYILPSPHLPPCEGAEEAKLLPTAAASATSYSYAQSSVNQSQQCGCCQ